MIVNKDRDKACPTNDTTTELWIQQKLVLLQIKDSCAVLL